jgi:peptide/nickel transport system substrate-binding protein
MRVRSVRWSRTMPMVVASALLLAACGNGDNDPDTDTDTDDGAAEEVDDESAEPEGDDVIAIALDSDVDLLEPHFFRSDAAYTVTGNVYEPLIRQQFEETDGFLNGTDEYEGALAESWEIADDGLEATFTLREDAAFADGTPITADDVKYVYQRAIEGPGYITALLPFIGISDADQIEVVDDQTLRFEPEFESPLFERFMTFQVFGAMDMEVAEQEATDDDPWATEYFTNEVTASGAYDVSDFERGRQVVLEPNSNYHSPDEIRNDGVVMRNVPNAEERALLLRSGELDVADGLPPRTVRELEDSGELTVHQIPSSRISYLGMNNSMEPFDDVRVRQAISKAVPYEAIREQVMFGYASPAYGPVPPAMESHVGDEHWDYETDLEEAQALLEEAGVTDLSTEIGVRQSSAEDVEAAVFVQDSLRQIGIDVEVNQLAAADFNERLEAGEMPMFFHDWFSWGEDPFFQMQFLLQSESFTNYARFDNEELDALIEEGTFETDEQRRNELSAEAQELVIEEAPWAFLYSADYLVVTQDDISGVTRPYDQVMRFSHLTRE